MLLQNTFLLLLLAIFCSCGVSRIHDVNTNSLKSIEDEMKHGLRVPHLVPKKFLKPAENISHTSQLNDKLYDLSKDLVYSILSKIDAQDKITKLAQEALGSIGRKKETTAIETRRVLDHISKTMSNQIMRITIAISEPELQKFVYGLAQTTAEVSIIAALKDITYATSLSKKQTIDMSIRRRRSIAETLFQSTASASPAFINNISTSDKALKPILLKTQNEENSTIQSPVNQFSVLPLHEKPSIRLMKGNSEPISGSSGFLNQDNFDHESKSGPIILTNKINDTMIVKVRINAASENSTLITDETQAMFKEVDEHSSDEGIIPDFSNDVYSEIEIEQSEIDGKLANQKKITQKAGRLENYAKKSIVFSGDVAYFTGASVVALRRALTASMEVKMAMKHAKNNLSNHQYLMMDLAKTAARQAGKEAKTASSKSTESENALRQAIKYAALSGGAKLNHAVNRVLIEAVALSTIAKSMSYVSSEMALDALYQVTEIKLS